jgi:hypothetical protein
MPNLGLEFVANNATAPVPSAAETASAVVHKPTVEGRSVLWTVDQGGIRTTGVGELSVRDSIQAPANGQTMQPYQEINNVLGEWCRVFTMSPAAAARQMIQLLQNYMTVQIPPVVNQ